MKRKLVVVSLFGLAIGLFAALAYVRQQGQTPASTSPDLATSASDEAQGGLPASKSAAPASTVAPAPAFSWRQIESEDYRQYIANLRSIGCPEQTIRDVIMADVNKLFAAREKPLKLRPKPTPDNPAGETPEQRLERLRQLRALQMEKRSVLKELLGMDMPLDLLPSSGSRDYHSFEVGLSFLPADKRDAVQLLQENYWQHSDALRAKYPSGRTPEFLAESRQLTDSLRQELAKVLTPQELEDYDLRTSPAAKQLSTSLGTYFRPTEEEFRQIFRTQRAYDEAIAKLSVTPASATPPVDGADPAALAQQRAGQRLALEQARSSALNQMNDQLKSILGDSRYTDYQRSQDRTFDMLARLGTRYGLPQETVLQAYDVQKSFSSRLGPSTQPGDRADWQRQLDEQLTPILGDQAARGYRRANGGTVPLN